MRFRRHHEAGSRRVDAFTLFSQASRVVARLFGREDLFAVVIEYFQTDTADYADILLPAATQLEHTDVYPAYGHLYMMANNPAIAPPGEAKPNMEIFRLLAARMGFDAACFLESDDEIASHAFDSSYARAAHLCIEFYESARSSPELAKRYPLAMISPPARNFLNCTFVNVESLRSTEGEPHLDMHPDDAAQRGVISGDRVRIYKECGSFLAKARVTDRVRQDMVVGLSIRWKKFAQNGKNANEVTGQWLTDMGSAPTFYDVLVQMEKAKG